MKRARRISILASRKQTRTPIHDTETEDLFKLLNANNYQKGAWVLHMLRVGTWRRKVLPRRSALLPGTSERDRDDVKICARRLRKRQDET